MFQKTVKGKEKEKMKRKRNEEAKTCDWMGAMDDAAKLTCYAAALEIEIVPRRNYYGTFRCYPSVNMI